MGLSRLGLQGSQFFIVFSIVNRPLAFCMFSGHGPLFGLEHGAKIPPAGTDQQHKK